MERGHPQIASGPTALPAADGGVAIEIDTSYHGCVGVLVNSLSEFRYAFADAHFNAGTYMVLPAGVWEIPVVGYDALFIERNIAAALANGVNTQIIRGHEV